MRIALLDAGLAWKGGHHFEHDRKLVRAFAAAGQDVHVYGYAGMAEEVEAELAALCPVTRLFRGWHYEAPGDGGELALFNRQAPRIAEDLRAVAPADVWVWPTMSAAQLHVCTRLGVNVPVSGSVHEDPGIAARAPGAMLWRVALVAAQERGLRFSLGSLEPELAERFAELVPDGRCAVLPQPYDGPPLVEPKTRLRRIGIFGQQRDEKGWAVISPLAERLAADGYDVVLHDSNMTNPAFAHPGVEVLRYVDDIATPIAACDMVVLPYERARYASMGSGILAECLSLGVPVMVTAGTIPANLVARHGVGPLFAEPSVEAILAAVAQAEADYAGYAARAWQVARDFAARNGSARYAAALLAGT